MRQDISMYFLYIGDICIKNTNFVM